MKVYKVQIDLDGLNDIEEVSDWYNNKLAGLGNRFS